jgi:hypothetical protein
MSRSPARLAAVSLACLLLPAGLARADLINWSFSWSPGAQTLHATSGTGTVKLSTVNGSIQSQSGDLTGLAAATVTFSPGNSLSHFSSVPFNLGLTLTDSASTHSGNLSFSGAVNGDLSKSATPGVTLNSPAGGSLTLGGNVYTVALEYVPVPAPPGFVGVAPGFLFAQVTATSPQTVPEPTSLVLAGLGLPVVGLAAWRKRRRAAPAA